MSSRLAEPHVHDRSIRSLARLQSSGSTSRVLNLNLLHLRHGEEDEHARRPFFRSVILNRSMIVKHRLRPQERELFDDYRTRATKLILPLDGADLRSGGRFAFVGQRGYEAIMNELIGEGAGAFDDRKTLAVLDTIPSFDPFLLREHLRRHDLAPAASYFNLSPGDVKKMHAFLQSELRALVEMSVTVSEGQLGASTGRIIAKLMSNGAGQELEPLGRTLRLTPSQYAEGVFCWKGFLYYKWRLGQLAGAAPGLVRQIQGVKPALLGGDLESRAYIADAKVRIGEALMANCRSVSELLQVYDAAYGRLTRSEDPVAFRDFLLRAPEMFVRLGELLGVIDHVAGFWSFRFPPGTLARISCDELADLLLDFEESLGCTEHQRRSTPAPQVLLAS